MASDSSDQHPMRDPGDPTIDLGTRGKGAGDDPDRTMKVPAFELPPGSDPTVDLGDAGAGGSPPGSHDEPTIQEGDELFTGAELPDAAALEGKQIGNYKVLSKLGEGGMGYVLKAHDRNLNRFVALKLLHPRMARKQAFVQQFRVEAEALAKLSHPSVVNVFNFGSTGGTVYFAMQFVRGHELSKLLNDQGQLPARTVVELMIPVVEGLAYTHGYGIMHRDLKPSNIMIDEVSGRPIVTDFGLAKIDVDIVKRRMDPEGNVHFDIPLAEQAALVGTPSYMAPELVAPDLYEGEDVQADIYAVGVIMYQLLTGVLPYRGESVSDTLAAALSRDPTPITSLATRQPPPDLVRCVGKAMARDPGDRYSSMERLLRDLRSVQSQWEQAAEIEKKAQISREMALAMSHGGVTRHGSPTGVKRMLTLAVLVIAALALGLIFLKRGDGGQVPGGAGGKGGSSVSGESPDDNRSTDLVWEAGKHARVFGTVVELTEVDDMVTVLLDDLRGEGPRTAIFKVPRRIWDLRNAGAELKPGGKGVLWGKVATTGDRGEIFDFTVDRERSWLIPLERPTLQITADGQSRTVTEISGDEVDMDMTVAGTIIGISEWDNDEGKHFVDFELWSPPRGEDEDPPLIGVSFEGRAPLAGGDCRPRLGDSLLAHGYVVEPGWVLVADPGDLARSRIDAAPSQP